MASSYEDSSESSPEDIVPEILVENPYVQILTELLELKKYDDGYQVQLLFRNNLKRLRDFFAKLVPKLISIKEWVETSRWIKYQETVEPEGNRWSKPHISTPSLRGWLELRRCLQNGLVLVDIEAPDFNSLCLKLREELVAKDFVNADTGDKLVELWQMKHRHQFEGPRKAEGKLTAVIKELLVQKLESKSGLQVPSMNEGRRRGSIVVDTEARRPLMAGDGKVNLALQKKISSSSEAAIILEGEVGFQDKPVAIFVKMKSALHLADMPEVDIPTRFFFFYTGPPNLDQGYSDVGVSLAVAFTDKEFATAIQAAQTGDEVRLAFDEYMSYLKILPKDWPEDAKVEPPSPSRRKIKEEVEEEIDEDRRMREASGLVRTKKFFGGLLNDLKRKRPSYVSDFIEGLHPQCLSSFLFLYFACLAPIVAFGALLGEATENRIATIESLVSGIISKFPK